MPRVTILCDTDIHILTFNATHYPSCADGSNVNAWQVVSEADLQVEMLADLSIVEGLEIIAAIALVWTIGYIGRVIIQTVMRTRYL